MLTRFFQFQESIQRLANFDLVAEAKALANRVVGHSISKDVKTIAVTENPKPASLSNLSRHKIEGNQARLLFPSLENILHRHGIAMGEETQEIKKFREEFESNRVLFCPDWLKEIPAERRRIDVWNSIQDTVRREGLIFPQEMMRDYSSFLKGLKEGLTSFPQRFGSLKTLSTLLQNKQNLSNHNDPRPVALLVYNTNDWNGAFNNPHVIDSMVDSEKFRVVYVEVKIEREAHGWISQASKEGGRPIHTLVLAGHGTSDSLQFGGSEKKAESSNPAQLSQSDSLNLSELNLQAEMLSKEKHEESKLQNPSEINLEALEKAFKEVKRSQANQKRENETDYFDVGDFAEGDFANFSKYIHPRGQILLYACSNGKEEWKGKNKRENLTDSFANILPHGVRIYSSKVDTNIQRLKINDDLSLSVRWAGDQPYTMQGKRRDKI